MSSVADVIAAIHAEGSTSWVIADQVAALDELDPETGRPLTLKQVSARIYAEEGVEWSPAVLSRYRSTAASFPSELRSSLPTQTFHVCLELRAHPDRLLKWKPKKPGDILTVERARSLRPPRSTSTSPTELRLKRLIATLYSLLDDAPDLVITVLEDVVRDAHAKYDRRIERERKRGLSAVS